MSDTLTEAHASRTGLPPHLVEVQRAVLDAALPDVAFDGWSDVLLRRAVAGSGVEPGLAKLAFPRGAADLAVAFHRLGDSEMLARLERENINAMRIREKITAAVRARLEIAGPHEEAVRRAASMYALPTHAAAGAALTWETADAIWNAAGDSAEDYNWYTKRMTLSGVFSATLLYWLNDTSPDKEASWRFLDRRIENVMQFEKTKAAVQNSTLGKAILAGPMAVLSRIRRPQRDGMPAGLGVGFPGRRSGGGAES